MPSPLYLFVAAAENPPHTRNSDSNVVGLLSLLPPPPIQLISVGGFVVALPAIHLLIKKEIHRNVESVDRMDIFLVGQFVTMRSISH